VNIQSIRKPRPLPVALITEPLPTVPDATLTAVLTLVFAAVLLADLASFLLEVEESSSPDFFAMSIAACMSF